MKKSTKVFAAAAMLAASLTVSAAAADFTAQADKLHSMDLFSGTGAGYELDRAPTRAETAVMLVRLLGGEPEAVRQKYGTPFTDVPDWAQPYVGWLYKKGLTAGETATTYGTDAKCTAQMYSAFLLRSLGYSEAAKDFQYDDALKYGEKIGVVDYSNCNAADFKRDHVVAMSYTTLSISPKDKAYPTLLDQLVKNGAVDAVKAKPIQDEFALFRSFNELVMKGAKTEKMSMSMTAAANVKMQGKQMMKQDIAMKMDAYVPKNNVAAAQIAMHGETKVAVDPSMVQPGEPTTMTLPMESYIANGFVYTKVGDVKQKMPAGIEAVQAQMAQMKVDANPITAYQKITKNADGGYDAVLASDAMTGVVQRMLASMNLPAEGIQMKLGECVQKIDANGIPKTVDMKMGMSVSAQGQKMDMDMTIHTQVTNSGSSVVVNLPSDLDTYTLIQQ